MTSKKITVEDREKLCGGIEVIGGEVSIGQMTADEFVEWWTSLESADDEYRRRYGLPRADNEPKAEHPRRGAGVAAKPTYTYRAALVTLTDSDTMVLRIDAGFRIWVETPIRLLGIDAPEKRSPAGALATAATKAWFSANPELIVTTLKAPEKYGRWLGVVQSVATQEILNDMLVASGHAKAWDGKGVKPI